MNPRVFKPEGLKHLDRVIDICSKHGIYTILDLHTVPGGQNGDWHSDSSSHYPAFWYHKDHQDRADLLWENLAKHFAGNPWVAGYNPLNEPTDPTHTRVLQFYQRVYNTIRKVDPHHIVFFDGNTFATDFSHFGDIYATLSHNVAWSIHDYSGYGFPGAEEYKGTPEQIENMERSYKDKRTWMDQRGLCVWNGEWGPVYARKQYDGEDTEKINKVRLSVLKDQLKLYNKDRLSWSIWTYKDIGFQGMTHVSLETPYMKLLENFLAKKHRLAVDAWGADDSQIAHVYQPLLDLIEKEVPEKYRNLYPWPVWSFWNRTSRLSRNILVSDYLVQEWADHFEGKSEEELDELAKSFRFDNCLHRDGLNEILKENAGLAR